VDVVAASVGVVVEDFFSSVRSWQLEDAIQEVVNNALRIAVRTGRDFGIRNLIRYSFGRNQITTVLGSNSSPPRWLCHSGSNSESG